jgi:uncharacterized protein YcbX
MRTLARLCVTPVKGTKLRHPASAVLGPGGLEGNRRFYLVDAAGALYSGSSHGPLVQVVADHDPAAGGLTLTMPDGTVIADDAPGAGPEEITDFYGRPVRAREVPGPFSEAFSAFVGHPVRLLRTEDDGAAADVEPVTLVSYASVRDLAGRGHHEGDLDPRRLRINLELEGCAPYDEDGWDGRRVAVGDAVVRIAGQIPRCIVTTQDPATGTKDWDTLTQIAKYRPRIGGTGGLPFGVYARVESPGPLSVGDSVAPLD